ncbi:MAG: hypothetical protein MET45_25645 [Nostoc sp. LLA-1]|nr:hypothetical protein [Cyanocohniella sp. LLY]
MFIRSLAFTTFSAVLLANFANSAFATPVNSASNINHTIANTQAIAQTEILAQRVPVAVSQDRYAAIWDKSNSSAWVARHGLTSAQYQAAFNQFVGQGYRLVDVSGYEVNGQARYAAIWDKSNSSAWVARHGLTSAQYQAAFDQFVGQGYRLVKVSGYNVNGQARYAAIWDKSNSRTWVARHGLTSAQYQSTFDQLVKQGYRLVDVSGY